MTRAASSRAPASCSLRTAAFTLVGEVAESATYVRQRRDGDEIVYEVGTGMLAADTEFAPHGHVLVLRVRGALS